MFRLLGAPVTVTKWVPDTLGATSTGRGAPVDFSRIAVAQDVARYDAARLNPEAVAKLTGIAIS